MNSRLSTFALFVAIALSSPAAALAKTGAEYAIRWDVAAGGPKTVADVLKVLDEKADGVTRYTIRYFTTTPPADAPTGFKAILRERKEEKEGKPDEYELTFKYRGEGALPAAITCPLSADPAESKSEVDISILGKDAKGKNMKRAESYSCTVESVGAPVPPPASLNATPRACQSTMTRTKADELKVEEWKLADGTTLIEVSRKGKDKKADLDEFANKIAKKLIKAGIQPSDRSKSELGGECD
jgi:hypothetical protein